MQGLVSNHVQTSTVSLSSYSTGAALMKGRAPNLPSPMYYTAIQGMASPTHAVLIGGANMATYNTSLTMTSYATSTNNVWRASCIYHAGYFMYGGGDVSGLQSVMHTWNASFTKSTATSLGLARMSAATAVTGNYVLFAGGDLTGGTSSAYVDAYDTALTRSTPTALSYVSSNGSGTSFAGYAVFAGGFSSGTYTDGMNYYNSSLTRTIGTVLSETKNAPVSGTNSSYMFVGGWYGPGGVRSTVVNAYNSSMVRSIPTGLTQGRTGIACAGNSDYVMFASGTNGTAVVNTTEFYDTSATRTLGPVTTDLTSTTQETSSTRAVAFGPYIVMGGGSTSYYDSKVVDTFFTGIRLQLPKNTSYTITGGPSGTITDSLGYLDLPTPVSGTLNFTTTAL